MKWKWTHFSLAAAFSAAAPILHMISAKTELVRMIALDMHLGWGAAGLELGISICQFFLFATFVVYLATGAKLTEKRAIDAEETSIPLNILGFLLKTLGFTALAVITLFNAFGVWATAASAFDAMAEWPFYSFYTFAGCLSGLFGVLLYFALIFRMRAETRRAGTGSATRRNVF
jgi:magnesium-transporting ATPase (P-type)